MSSKEYANAKDLFKHTADRLSVNGNANEAVQIAFILFEHVFGLDRSRVLAGASLKNFNRFCFEELELFVEKVLDHTPVQYVVGNSPFYGRSYKVNPHVLIPRPETEELVQMVLKNAAKRPGLKILDVGTGSGCIAITLALELNLPFVVAYDYSYEVLNTARHNAAVLGANVNFVKEDILNPTDTRWQFDIIVSNPPYIAESEKCNMPANVTDHEPASALFVPDADPLIFYRAVALYGLKCLVPGGSLYFEINERYPEATVELLLQTGYSKAEAFRDINGKYRMVAAML